ncbi:hypothetical protein LOK55_04300 [Microbacterium sp. F2E]|uniref:hypothetical protein n=1 Tax=Microbacterium sp. F2E TaxID=2895284 RepID=UPI001E31F7D0|nr:hypothetical protein [Microbacterium sp. F2E]MCC9053530.1 hypothetical protein [Microbacterium sp. F2E]
MPRTLHQHELELPCMWRHRRDRKYDAKQRDVRCRRHDNFFTNVLPKQLPDFTDRVKHGLLEPPVEMEQGMRSSSGLVDLNVLPFLGFAAFIEVANQDL